MIDEKWDGQAETAQGVSIHGTNTRPSLLLQESLTMGYVKLLWVLQRQNSVKLEFELCRIGYRDHTNKSRQNCA